MINMKNSFYKIKKINFLLFFALCCCFWVILSVQLQLIPLIQTNFTDDFCNQLNTVYTNLAYSFIAGYMFYLLTSILPTIQDRQKLKPVLREKIANIKSCIMNIPLEFARDTGLDYKKRENCEEIMLSKTWTDNVPMYEKYRNIRLSYIGLIATTGITVKDDVSLLIRTYQRYLTTKQILLLEELADMLIFKHAYSLSHLVNLEIAEKRSLTSLFCEVMDKVEDIEKEFDR